MSFESNFSYPIEFIIPRDPNSPLPAMILQNVTSYNTTSHSNLFNLHFINLTTFQSIYSMSLHFSMRPLNASLGYLLVYRFDYAPQMNKFVNNIDGWSLFCPSRKSWSRLLHVSWKRSHVARIQIWPTIIFTSTFLTIDKPKAISRSSLVYENCSSKKWTIIASTSPSTELHRSPINHFVLHPTMSSVYFGQVVIILIQISNGSRMDY